MGYISVVKHYRVPDHEESVDITIMDERYASGLLIQFIIGVQKAVIHIIDSQLELLKKGK